MLTKGTLIGVGIVVAGLVAFFGAKALTGSFVGDSSGGSNQRPPIAGITVPPIPPPPGWPVHHGDSDSGEDREGSGTEGTSASLAGSTEKEPEPFTDEPPVYPSPPPPKEDPTPPSEEGNGGSGGGWVTGGRAGG
jgi:hypothetical protein